MGDEASLGVNHQVWELISSWESHQPSTLSMGAWVIQETGNPNYFNIFFHEYVLRSYKCSTTGGTPEYPGEC